MTDFDKALAFVLRWEGGFVDDPDDFGGATNKGVTQRTYDEYRKHKGFPVVSVKLIAPAEVAEIYRKQYWDVWESWGISGDLRTAVFDTAVNMGVSRTGKMLKQTGKDLKKFLLLRLATYQKFATVGNQRKFLAGWLNRLDDLCELVKTPLGVLHDPKRPYL